MFAVLVTLLCITQTLGLIQYEHSVKVLHYILPHWGESVSGLQECGNIACDWTHSEHVKQLKDHLYFTEPRNGVPTISLTMYNIHSLWERMRILHPLHCDLKTNLTMTESEESKVRYGYLFDQGYKNFDGYTSTSPNAAVQRVYMETHLNSSQFLTPLNFSTLIKAASYVASDCHRHDSANADRDSVVHRIRQEGFRVDGLGRCMHQIGPEGVSLPKTRDTRYNLFLKRKTIGHFMFNMAFENSLEPGYVTEKPFDAMIAGTVPVYLGDSVHLKSVLPHPKAAIFVADFQNNYTALATYLTYLTTNETAYEEHRQWRYEYDYEKNIANKPILQNSWHCRVCQWAVREAQNMTKFGPNHTGAHTKRTHICPNATASAAPVKAPADWEGKAVRGAGSRQVYIVKEGALRGVPDGDTFLALGFSFEKIMVVGDKEVEALWIGDPLPRKIG
eukprot:gene8576-10162_t